MERVEAVLLLDSRLKRGLPQWFISKESSCQCRKYRGRWFSPWVRKIFCGPMYYSCNCKWQKLRSIQVL